MKKPYSALKMKENCLPTLLGTFFTLNSQSLNTEANSFQILGHYQIKTSSECCYCICACVCLLRRCLFLWMPSRLSGKVRTHWLDLEVKLDMCGSLISFSNLTTNWSSCSSGSCNAGVLYSSVAALYQPHTMTWTMTDWINICQKWGILF